MRRKNKAIVNLKAGRFDNVDSTVIISSVSKAKQNCKLQGDTIAFSFFTALLTLLMMTAESMLSKHSVLRITVALFFLLKTLM